MDSAEDIQTYSSGRKFNSVSQSVGLDNLIVELAYKILVFKQQGWQMATANERTHMHIKSVQPRPSSAIAYAYLHLI